MGIGSKAPSQGVLTDGPHVFRLEVKVAKEQSDLISRTTYHLRVCHWIHLLVSTTSRILQFNTVPAGSQHSGIILSRLEPLSNSAVCQFPPLKFTY